MLQRSPLLASRHILLLTALACGEPSTADGSGGASAAGGADTGGSGNGGVSGGTSTGGAAGSVGGTAPAAGGSSGGAPPGDGGSAPAAGGGTGAGGTFAVGGTGGLSYELCGPEPLELMGPVIEPMVVLDQSAPTPMGGTMVDGIYDLVSYVFYGEFDVSALPDDYRQVIRVREGGTRVDSFSASFGSLRETSISVSGLDVSETALVATLECPSDSAGGMGEQPYTATPTTVTFFVPQGPGAVTTHVLRE